MKVKLLSMVSWLQRVFWESKVGYLALLVVTFVVARMGTWFYPYDSDHWIFYYVGKDWLQGGSLYVTAWDHKPPVIFLINGLMSYLGDSLVVHRVILTLFVFVDTYLFYLLAKKLAPKIAAGKELLFTKVSLLLYVFWRNLLSFTSSGNNNENFGLIFYLGMLLGYFSFREDKKWWKLALSGTCFSVLFFMKGNFLLLAAPLGIMLLADNYKNLIRFIGYAFAFGLPLVAMAGAWISYFSSQGALDEFIVASFTFSAKYSGSAWKGDLSNLRVFYYLVAIASVLLIFTPLVFWLKSFANRKSHELTFIALSLLFGSFAFFGIGVPYLYYFLILMPVYVLAAAYMFVSGENYNRLLWNTALAAFVVGMVINLGYAYYQLYLNQYGDTMKEARVYREIADYVRAHSVATDKVFANDYGATFYQLSERKSGSRYISASVLLLDYRGHYGFGLNDTFMKEMDNSKAKYIVVYTDKDNLYTENRPIEQYFANNYETEKDFGKFTLLIRTK